MKFRKKPVVIEAVQWTGKNIEEIEIFSNSKVKYYEWYQLNESGVNKNLLSVRTLEGEMLASINDWIIKGVKGEFYPCKPDIFDATYEPVTD